MKIVVAVRCLNEINNIDRFMRGYDFADEIVVSDGGSTDGSVELLHTYPKVRLIHFDFGEIIDGVFWNTDAPHMNFVLDAAKALEPDWLIFDDMDDVPNYILRENARLLMEDCRHSQINAFRLYMWNDNQYFPFLNRNFDPAYTSLWAWKPREIDIHADEEVRHGTLDGLSSAPYNVEVPHCLLHKSWDSQTIDAKVDRYNTIGLPMGHPFTFAGEPKDLPDWAHE